MRLLDTYALYCGAKIDKPFLYESFFPLPFDKYVTFQAETPYDSRNYSYWQDVIDMVVPILSSQGISVLQLGTPKENSYQRVVNLLGQTSFHQLGYLMRNSLLHFGPDSFGTHLSSFYDIPVVSLYSISMPEVAGPHFGSKDKCALFKGYERVGNKKPSYSPKENPKSINSIRPEEVANAIFKLLGIEAKIPIETVFTGERYSNKIIRELIPNHVNVMPMPEQPIEIRYDMASDLALLGHHLSYWQKAVVITNKEIDINLLKRFKPHIAVLVYEVTENDSPAFAKSVIEAGIQLALISNLPAEKIKEKKINYYEFGVIKQIPTPNETKVDELRKDIDKLYYRSCKLIFSDGQVFASHADVEAKAPLATDFEYRKVIDSPNFWKDMDFFTIVKKL